MHAKGDQGLVYSFCGAPLPAEWTIGVENWDSALESAVPAWHFDPALCVFGNTNLHWEDANECPDAPGVEARGCWLSDILTPHGTVHGDFAHADIFFNRTEWDKPETTFAERVGTVAHEWSHNMGLDDHRFVPQDEAGSVTGVFPDEGSPLQGPTASDITSVVCDVYGIGCDIDGDGFLGSTEMEIGTNYLAGCGAGAWPPDFNDDSFSDISDISQLTALFGQSVPPAPARKDIAPDPPDSFVDITDISRVTGIFGATCAGLSSSSAFAVQSGSYIGDQSSPRFINVGFRPDVVIIKSGHFSHPAIFRTSNMPSCESYSFDSEATLTAGILSLDTSGFTVGNDARVNGPGPSGTIYQWFAISDGEGLGANIKFGSYTGDGSPSHSITGVGFQPAWVFVKRDNPVGSAAIQRQPDMPANQSFTFGGGSIAEPYTNGILSLDSDGFRVGTLPDANASGSTFYYVAFETGPNFKTGSYMGDSTDNRTIAAPGLLPDFVNVKGDSGAASSVARWRATGSGFPKPEFPENTSIAYTQPTLTSGDAIQQMLRGGFQVGTDDDVNAANIPYYWVALDAALPPGVALGDVELVSVNVAAPPTANAGVQFVVSASAHLFNHGPASSVLVDTTFAPVFPAGCSGSPGTVTTQNTTLLINIDVLISRAWNVTCSQAGTYEFRFDVTVVIDPSQQTPDSDPSNNSGSGMGTTQVN